jgi:hypothetical protein
MRAVAIGVGLAVLALFAPVAGAEEPPPFNGLMDFPAIQGPADPEQFSWEVHLGEEQDLRQIDDRNAGVYYEDEHLAFDIAAALAHDAEGSNVPTTLAVTEPNVITLTVHHRAGNPAAGGASFVYPITAGAGWEGGFKTYPIVIQEPTHEGPPAVAPHCVVPDLSGLTLKAGRRQLRKAHCKLGPVRGDRTRGARVEAQFREPGKSLAAGTRVGVKLLKVVQGIPAAG